MPPKVLLAKEYEGFHICRICNKKSNKGRKEKPLWLLKPEGKHTFVCEECLIKNKKGILNLK